MSIRYYKNSAIDLLGRIVFPKSQPSVRRRNLRFFLLSVFLGLMFSTAFGYLLIFLNKQGRL